MLSPLPAAAQMQPAGSVIAALSGDWNQDQVPDAVLILRAAEGMADLVVLTGDPVDGLHPLITLPGVVSAGPMAGQLPGLETQSVTSFAITTQQSGIGRTAWHQRITVAWRDGGFVVAGYDYDFYDRLDLSRHGICSVNLLSGRFELTFGPGDEAAQVQRQGATDGRAFPLADLGEEFSAPACAQLFR